MQSRMLFALAALSAGAAAAQSDRRPDPKDAATPVPRLEYRSAFADYQRFAAQEVVPWREVNEEVARAAAKPKAQAKPEGKPAASGHGGKH